MNKSGLRQKLFRGNQPAGKSSPTRIRRRRKFSVPAIVFEIQPEYVLGARIARSSRKVARIAVGALDAGTVTPLIGRPNLLKPEEVAETIKGLARVLGSDKGPLGLLLPDAAVRVSVLGFETLPANRKEQESLIRWKMKPLLPFPVDDARLSFEVAAKEPEGVEAIVVAVRKSVAAEYESLLAPLNGEVALVLPTTAALLPLLGENGAEGELLLHVSQSQLTAVVVGGQQIRLWRNQALNGKSSAEQLPAVMEEAARTLAAAHDHLGIEVNRVSLCARPSVPEDYVAELGRAISREVELLAPDPLAAGIKLSDEEEKVLTEVGATILGILANAV